MFYMLCLCNMNITRTLLTKIGDYFHGRTAVRNMHLVQYLYNNKQLIGVLQRDKIVQLTGKNIDGVTFPNNVVEFLEGGEQFLSVAKNALSSNICDISYDLTEVKLLSPITKCEKVVCVGMNYKDHCSEQNFPFPVEPIIFSKFPSTIIGNGDSIILPKLSDSVDWEVELAVVIGKSGKHIKKEEALNYVAGYTVANDVSARDWQMKKNAKQWLLGKTFDTHCPLGPALVTKDEIEEVQNLKISCIINDKIVQSSCTSEMIFNVSDCIAWISQFCTLKPGDVLLTGTPPGVGVFQEPPVFLKQGDIVTCDIENIGKLTNNVVNETPIG